MLINDGIQYLFLPNYRNILKNTKNISFLLYYAHWQNVFLTFRTAQNLERKISSKPHVLFVCSLHPWNCLPTISETLFSPISLKHSTKWPAKAGHHYFFHHTAAKNLKVKHISATKKKYTCLMCDHTAQLKWMQVFAQLSGIVYWRCHGSTDAQLIQGCLTFWRIVTWTQLKSCIVL